MSQKRLIFNDFLMDRIGELKRRIYDLERVFNDRKLFDKMDPKAIEKFSHKELCLWSSNFKDDSLQKALADEEFARRRMTKQVSERE